MRQLPAFIKSDCISPKSPMSNHVVTFPTLDLTPNSPQPNKCDIYILLLKLKSLTTFNYCAMQKIHSYLLWILQRYLCFPHIQWLTRTSQSQSVRRQRWWSCTLPKCSWGSLLQGPRIPSPIQTQRSCSCIGQERVHFDSYYLHI
jgi:hypothetical protein